MPLKNPIRTTADVLHEILPAAGKSFVLLLLLGVTSLAVAASDEVFTPPWKQTDAWKPEDSAGTRSTCRNEWGFNFWSPGHFSEEHFRWMK